MRSKYLNLRRNLSCEKLDSRQLLASDVVPEIEPNNSEVTSTRFELTSTGSVKLTGISQSKDDKDFFVFTSPVDMRVAANAGAANGAKLEVTTRAGAQLFESEPKDGITAGSWQARAGETYLLRMRSANKSAASYEVTLQAQTGTGNNSGGGTTGGGSSSTGAEVEPNDRTTSATSVSLTPSAILTLTGAASKRDRDFFRVEVASGGTVQVDTGNSGIKVSIETPAGAKLFESEPRDGVTSGSFSTSTGDVFFVRARGTGSSVTTYAVKLNLSATPASTDQPVVVSSLRDAWLDSSDDGIVSALDALVVINQINAHGAGHSADDALISLDTNDDRIISAMDALMVINRINRRGSTDINDAFDDSDIRRRNQRS